MFKTYQTLEQATHVQQRVTALLACQNNLMPASWHMPVSKSPFRYAVAVREENFTHQLIEKNGSFTLNFMPFEYHEIVALMGDVHGDSVDKLTLSNLDVESRDAYGNPLLNDSDFVYECRVCDSYKNGDHTVFITDVKQIHVNDTQSGYPMFFSGQRRYATIGKITQLTKRR